MFRRQDRYASGVVCTRNVMLGEERYGKGRACERKRKISNGAADAERAL